MSVPPYLSDCAPDSRVYPSDWKWAYYRLHGGTTTGYHCPMCKKLFVGPGASGYLELHGDHAKSWSDGGRTTWDNLQLLCGRCNLRKSAGSHSNQTGQV